MSSRYLKPVLLDDALASHKMAFLSGPRQVGKTSLAKECLQADANYFNWDETAFKKSWIKNPLHAIEAAGNGPVVLDEIHKYSKWKNSLKGLYDRVGKTMPLIVTGSAKLDLYKRGGDSLLGRYLPYRLHPFTVAERDKNPPKPDALASSPVSFHLQDILRLSGFPEPLLGGSEKKAMRWSRLRLEQIIRTDIRDFKNVIGVDQMMLLALLLPDRVGSPLSLNSLREDLDIAYGTIREWMRVLESVYVCFKVSPYSKNVARSLKKESKYYLFDGLGIVSPGARLENTVALHLAKVCDFWTDTAEGVFELCYLRTQDKDEVDFCVLRDKRPWMLVECKSNATEISPTLRKYAALWPQTLAYQLTTQSKIDRRVPGTSIRLMSVESFLSQFI